MTVDNLIHEKDRFEKRLDWFVTRKSAIDGIVDQNISPLVFLDSNYTFTCEYAHFLKKERWWLVVEVNGIGKNRLWTR